MVKNKKITVQYYANTNLKAKSIIVNGKMISAFPLYAIIIYDTKNIRTKVSIQDNEFYVSEDLAELGNPESKGLLNKYEQFVQKIIRSEAELLGDKFSLKGLGKRMLKYQKDVRKVFSKATFEPDFIPKSTLEEYDWHSFSFDYTSIANCFHPLDFEKLTVFEWVYGDTKKVVIDCALTGKLLGKKKLETTINILDIIARYYLGR